MDLTSILRHSQSKLSIIAESAEDINPDNESDTIYIDDTEIDIPAPNLQSYDTFPSKSVSYADFLLDFDIATTELERGSKTSLNQSQWSFRNLSIAGGSESALDSNFLKTFTKIPDLDDVSEDDDEWLKGKLQKPIEKTPSQPGIDPGKFVDSLTGIAFQDESDEENIEEPPKKIRSKRSMKSIRSARSMRSIRSMKSSGSTSEHEVAQATAEKQADDALTYTEEEEESEEEELEEDDDLLQEFDYEDEVEDTGVAEPIEDDMLNEFFQMETKEKPATSVATVDFESLVEAEEARQIRLCITEFFDDLITEVIKKSEYLDVKIKLRNSLDKFALVDSILRIFVYLRVEGKTRSFLNRKIVDYFRRKKMFNPITERNLTDVEKDFARYKNAIQHLDETLGKEAATIKAVKAKIQELKSELAQKEQESANSDENLKNLIKGTMAREGFNRLKTSVENQVNKMMALHAEMAEARLTLTQRQHTFATLDEKHKKLERISENLFLKDYENLQAETQSLSKKVEERNIELIKARDRINVSLHMMSHMHEKEIMLKNLHTTQLEILNDLYAKKQALRTYVANLNSRRFRILQEIERTNFKAGILSKPKLMHDYDVTFAHNQELRARIEKLNHRQAFLNDKIEQVTEKIQSGLN